MLRLLLFIGYLGCLDWRWLAFNRYMSKMLATVFVADKNYGKNGSIDRIQLGRENPLE
jgi:hypothetical protein